VGGFIGQRFGKSQYFCLSQIGYVMNVTLQLVFPEDLQVLLPLLERLHITYQIGI